MAITARTRARTALPATTSIGPGEAPAVVKSATDHPSPRRTRGHAAPWVPGRGAPRYRPAAPAPIGVEPWPYSLLHPEWAEGSVMPGGASRPYST